MSQGPLLQQLMEALRCLPGVGPKTAQRMAFHLLERDRNGAARLASVMSLSLEHIRRCSRCRTLTEHEVCEICSDSGRNAELLCVVENPADALAIEQSAAYRGYYFILLGNLSPLDGVGPEELGLNQLEERLREGETKEIILATNSTVEGEVTASYINEMAQSLTIGTSRIAHGVPFGGELEYIDGQTLSHAFNGRTRF